RSRRARAATTPTGTGASRAAGSGARPINGYVRCNDESLGIQLLRRTAHLYASGKLLLRLRVHSLLLEPDQWLRGAMPRRTVQPLRRSARLVLLAWRQRTHAVPDVGDHPGTTPAARRSRTLHGMAGPDWLLPARKPQHLRTPSTY